VNANRVISLLIILIVIASACKDKKPATSDKSAIIDVKKVSPWCITGFDTKDRSPQERRTMLQDLGLSSYGFNKGKGDFSTMQEEFKLAKENDIDITSIFIWLNADRDTIGQLSPSNQLIFDNLKEIEQKPTLWLSFSNNFYEDLDREASITLSMEMIKFIKSKADELGCKLALYNHRGWFGNPHNQLEILERLKDESITMVYNFHHAHEYAEEFELVAKKISPYLSFVNLNGVKIDGPEIMDIGKGDHELAMIQYLLNEAYDGPWGILGHLKTEDVRLVLERN